MASIIALLGLTLREAVDDQRLPVAPCRRLRVVTEPYPEHPLAPQGGFHHRSDFTRRTWHPALDTTDGAAPLPAGMHFHDLRHTHKTWLIEDNIPEVTQAKRLGHHMPGTPGIYSHVTPHMQRRLLAVLQRRWETSARPQPKPDCGAPPRQ